MNSKNNPDHRHFKLFKPYGYLSQFESNSSKEQRKQFLGSLYDFPQHSMSIGRLDEKSEGLLLITTDGLVSNFINSSSIEKEYYVQVDGNISKNAIEELKQGVEIGFDGKKYMTNSCEVFKLNQVPNFPERGKKIRDARHGPTSWLSITLTEGKYRQVRKMTSAVGFPTLRLLRVRVGTIYLESMNPGEVIELKTDFIEGLKN